MTMRETILDQAMRNVTTPETRRTTLLWAENKPAGAPSTTVLGIVADIRWEFACLWEGRPSSSLAGDITRRLFER
jgi:hypothetical protein